jgi:hypothetical protein
LARNLRRIEDQLRSGRFEFDAQKGVAKQRSRKRARPLVISAIKNRVVQRAILDTLHTLPCVNDIFEVKTSIGGIPERGREYAFSLIREAIKRGAIFYIRSDISDFFSAIPRPRIIEWFGDNIEDEQFISLLSRATETNLMNADQLGDDAILFPSEQKGVAQGNPLSPLFGNILLKDFDRELNGRNITCIRYIDDFILLGPNEASVLKAFRKGQGILDGFGLEAYDPSTGSSKAEMGQVKSGFDFLGCRMCPGLLQPSRSARANILRKIDEILDDGRRSIKQISVNSNKQLPKHRYVQTLDHIDRTLKGWGHAFAFCNGRHVFREIDEEVDRRIATFRMFARRMTVSAPAATQRRILGVHLLVDTPLAPLPT